MITEKKQNGWNSNNSKNNWNSKIKDKRAFFSGMVIGFGIGIIIGSMLL
ncbi:hypothetical protein SAMN05421840_1191 [Shewanella morhuae]|nr:hypothetical protein [Shewanella morhuae]SIR39027.1 hypothetical protein SAMN05421840_1191 [Shewanella morhuae]